MMRTEHDVNVRVINASFGFDEPDEDMESAIADAGDAGILLVASAGNDGTNNDFVPSYPASYDLPNVISVAATDENDSLAYFSNYGASSVDIAAPGVNIYSTLPGDTYGMKSGTSMAAPHVSGVAALAYSAAPNASMADIRAAILGGHDWIAALNGQLVTDGRLNAQTTLQSLKRIIDNGNSGFSTTGNWSYGTGGGFQNDQHWTAGVGTGETPTATASWTFSDLTPGRYRVSAYWGAAGTNATDSPFTFFDGANELWTARMNQEVAPNDFEADGVYWEDLAWVTVTSGTLVVTLKNNADQYVVADAVRIEKYDTETQYIDDGDPVFYENNPGWSYGTGSGFQNDQHWVAGVGTQGTPTATASWIFSGLEPGRYRVAGYWGAVGTNATDSPFTLSDGATALGTVRMNQEVAPNDFQADGVYWENIDWVTVTSGTLIVELKNNADQYVVADAVRIEKYDTETQYIDDGDPVFYENNPGWSYGTGSGFQNDQHWAAGVGTQGTPTAEASWTFSGLTPGRYRVSAYWGAVGTNATDSPFTFSDGATTLGTVRVNQEVAPNDFLADGVLLGGFWLGNRQQRNVGCDTKEQRESVCCRRRCPHLRSSNHPNGYR